MPPLLKGRTVLRLMLLASLVSAAVNLLLLVCSVWYSWNLNSSPSAAAQPNVQEFHLHLGSKELQDQRDLAEEVAFEHPKTKLNSSAKLLPSLDLIRPPFGHSGASRKIMQKLSNATGTAALTSRKDRAQNFRIRNPISPSKVDFQTQQPIMHLKKLSAPRNSSSPRSTRLVQLDSQLPAIPLPNIVLSKNVDCGAVIAGHKNEIENAVNSSYAGGCYADPSNIKYIVRNCKSFIEERGFIATARDEELAFPIAYSILFYRNLCQFERFLRAIWRPQNLYCVHLDASSPPALHSSVRAIVSCFHNVFFASRLVDVVWGRTVLDADLQCMDDLLHRRNVNGVEWKYFVNTNAHEFPLRTNLEIVRVLRTLNGANSVNRAVNEQQTSLGHIKAPFGVRLWKGETHILGCRGFVEFMRKDPLALNLTSFIQARAFNPGETVYSTFNFNARMLQAPGAFTGDLNQTHLQYGYFHRYKHWMAGPKPRIAQGTFDNVSECGGKWYYLCLYGVADLQRLTDVERVVALFANKLYWHFQPHALDCLEQWHTNRSREELEGRLKPIDLSYYRGITSVIDHLPCHPFQ